MILAEKRQIARLRTIIRDGGLVAPQHRISRREFEERLRSKLEQNSQTPPPF